jgi:hypothetical protein
VDRKHPEDIGQALAECEQQVDQLTRENKLLRDASRTFADLAERLNASLGSDRRRTPERRAHAREPEDRRATTSPVDQSRR